MARLRGAVALELSSGGRGAAAAISRFPPVCAIVAVAQTKLLPPAHAEGALFAVASQEGRGEIGGSRHVQKREGRPRHCVGFFVFFHLMPPGHCMRGAPRNVMKPKPRSGSDKNDRIPGPKKIEPVVTVQRVPPPPGRDEKRDPEHGVQIHTYIHMYIGIGPPPPSLGATQGDFDMLHRGGEAIAAANNNYAYYDAMRRPWTCALGPKKQRELRSQDVGEGGSDITHRRF